MNKTFNLALLFLVLLCATFVLVFLCSTICPLNPKPENHIVTDAITSLQQELPIKMEGLGTIREVDYDENSVILRMRIQEDDLYEVNVQKISSHKGLAQEIISSQISMMNDEVKNAINSIAEQSYNLCVVINGSNSLNSVEIYLMPEDLKYAVVRFWKSADDFSLSMIALSTKLMLPLKADPVTTWTNTRLTDTTFEYIYKIDDKGMDLENVDIESMRLERLELLRQNMDLLENVVKGCISTNRNLVYKYIGRFSDKTIDIVITDAELRYI